jgi:hypothetical protein
MDYKNILPPSIKECNYGFRQISSSLTKFIIIVLTFMSINKFISKIYSITNLMVLILCKKYFLYKFSQSLNCLTSQKARLHSFMDNGSISILN